MTNELEQSSRGEGVQPEDTDAKCWACREKMHKGQVFCTKCSNWQGWIRRKLNFSNALLSLFAAFLAVFGGAAFSVVEAIRGTPEPSLYVFGELSDDWRQLDLTVENLNEFDRILPFLFECELFGAVAGEHDRSMRFFNTSPTLVRRLKNIEISYKVDPKTQLPSGYHVSSETLSGLRCKGGLGGNDADYQLDVTFNNEQSIRFSLDDN